MRSIHLLPGTYRVGLWLADPVQAQSVTGAYDYVESAFEIEVRHARPGLAGAGPARSSPATSRWRSCPDAAWAEGQSRHRRQGRSGSRRCRRPRSARPAGSSPNLHGDSTTCAALHRAPGHGVRRAPAPAARQGHTPVRSRPHRLRTRRAPRHHRRAQRRAVRSVLPRALPGARRPPLCVSRQLLHRRHRRQTLRPCRRDGAPDRCAVREIREHDEALPRGALLPRQVEPLRRHRRALRLPVRA